MNGRSAFFCLLALLVALPAAAVPYAVPFDLGVGQSAAVGPDGVVVGFTGVSSDSRCPLGVLCFWPGDAETALWIERPGYPRQEFVLHTYYDWDQEQDFEQWRVSLLQVAPYPVFAGDPIDPADYVVTLQVSLTGVVPATPTAWGALKARYR